MLRQTDNFILDSDRSHLLDDHMKTQQPRYKIISDHEDLRLHIDSKLPPIEKAEIRRMVRELRYSGFVEVEL